MKVLFKFIGLGYHDKYQANIKIYDNNNIIYEGTTYDGIIYVDLIPNKVYKIEASFFSTLFLTSIITNRCLYTFTLNHAIYSHNITLSLKDYYYNMPIEKGVITLWQKR